MTQEISELLFNGINEQGYLFQERCHEILQTAKRHTSWRVEGYNYPVSLKGQETKIDIVLQEAVDRSLPKLCAVVECKRADPEYVYWLFGAPGLPSGNAEPYLTTLEYTEDRPGVLSEIVAYVSRPTFLLDAYVAQNWMEVKKRTKGKTSTPQNIENAFVQVLTGAGGLANEQRLQSHRKRSVFKVSFIPVVITTASLYVAQYEIRDVDEKTGRIAKDKVLFGPKDQGPDEEPWVLVNYGVGEALAQPEIPRDYNGVDPAELYEFKQRSIFVVNSQHISEFFFNLRLI